MNKQQLATKIWESANKMRSKIEANEYKDYILGFIFYKYLSDKELEFLKENSFSSNDIMALSEEDAETVKYIRESIGYFISYKDLFSTWLGMGNKFGKSNVTDALSAFNRLINPSHRKVFEGIFTTLETGLSKLGESDGARTKAISDLLYLIKDIPMDSRQDYDVLGFIYEFLINMFAANAGKKAGEFYTPHEVSLLMSEIVANHLKERKEINIYDPTSGSGSLLINIGRSASKYIDKNNIKYYAQELKQNTYNLTRMNLVMRGILPDNIITRNGDTLEDDWPYFDDSDPTGSYNPLYVDAVFSNPPYSQHWDPSHKETDPRYASFGLAPKTKADYAFLLHDLFHLKPDGIMTIVLPHGVLFRGGDEGEIRKKLIEKNHIDAIIGLPANVFFGTGIPTIVMVLRQKRPNTDVLFIDASKGFLKVGKNNKLRASDIKKIVDTVLARADVEKFAKKVSREDIRNNDYNLNIPRYVDSSDDAETWDIYASMFGGIPRGEVAALERYWQALPGLQQALFAVDPTPYTHLVVEDIHQAVSSHPAVMAFYADFAKAFAGFDDDLKQELVANMVSVNIARQEEALSRALFDRLDAIPLVSKYEAYQLLDDAWATTAVDLEIIQTEGFAAVKTIDPRMVLKKKGDKEEEVQDGWQGRVIPFELVQQTLLADDYTALKAKEARFEEIAAECAEILDGLSEEDKETECINDSKDAFVAAKVAKEAKRIQAETKQGTVFDEESLEVKLVRVNALLAEEKTLKSVLKKESAALHMKTKATIEGLTDEQARTLLEQKWITPLIASLHQMPELAVQTLVAKVKALAEKYSITYAQIEADMQETGASLAALLGDLVGNDYDMQAFREMENLLKGNAHVKKALLEKMLPESDSTAPEVRFKGCSEKWKAEKFVEIFAYVSNNTLSRACLNYCEGYAKNIHYGDILIKYDEILDIKKNNIPYINDDIDINKINDYSLKNGDVIIADAAEDETVGKCTEIVNIGNEKVVSGLHTIPCRPKQAFAFGYLGYFMNSPAYRKQLMHLMQGSKVKSLSKSALHNTIIRYPNDIHNTEQTRIGELFRHLATLISLQQRKYEKLQNIKKAMLGKMFI